MYKCYNLEIDDANNFSDWFELESFKYELNKIAIRSTLSDYLDSDGEIVARKVISDWFPDMKSNIFISHSHKDNKLAIGLAGWLSEKFGLTSFIDSCVWGCSSELLKEIDNAYSLSDTGPSKYDYKKRNNSTAHVHMMLSTALANMIDSCECIIFLNTPSSISTDECLGDSTTQSAWIYSEISLTEIIRKTTPERLLRKSVAAMENRSLTEDVKFKHSVGLKHMDKLSFFDLSMWDTMKMDMSGEKTLDTLYSLME